VKNLQILFNQCDDFLKQAGSLSERLSYSDIKKLESERNSVYELMDSARKKHRGSYGIPEEAKEEFMPLYSRFKSLNMIIEDYYDEVEGELSNYDG